MTMRIISLALVALTLPGAALADGFCGVTDEAVVFERLAGEWTREGTVSVENQATSLLRPSRQFYVSVSDQGAMESGFLDSLTGEAGEFDLLNPRRYDVDAVDDMLDTTERSDIADLLSDTKCGPEELPQLEITLPETDDGISVSGNITWIAYFDDRVLEVSELTLRTEDTVVFMTETAILRPASD